MSVHAVASDTIEQAIMRNCVQLIEALTPTVQPSKPFKQLEYLTARERLIKTSTFRHFFATWADALTVEPDTCDSQFIMRRELDIEVAYNVPNGKPAGDIQSLIQSDASQIAIELQKLHAQSDITGTNGFMTERRQIPGAMSVVPFEADRMVSLMLSFSIVHSVNV